MVNFEANAYIFAISLVFLLTVFVGIFQSDVAVLVTSALMSEVSQAELTRSQAEEQLMVAFCFGVRFIVVAVNKMDSVNYSKDCFDDVCAHTAALLKKAGFKPDQAGTFNVVILLSLLICCAC